MVAEGARTRRWWAQIGLGAVICVGCCLAQILIAAGVLGGGIAVGLEPLGIALIAAGVIGLFWSRARTRRTGCNGCTGSGCGCTTVTAP